jgi:hypothetical protein
MTATLFQTPSAGAVYRRLSFVPAQRPEADAVRVPPNVVPLNDPIDTKVSGMAGLATSHRSCRGDGGSCKATVVVTAPSQSSIMPAPAKRKDGKGVGKQQEFFQEAHVQLTWAQMRRVVSGPGAEIGVDVSASLHCSTRVCPSRRLQRCSLQQPCGASGVRPLNLHETGGQGCQGPQHPTVVMSCIHSPPPSLSCPHM